MGKEKHLKKIRSLFEKSPVVSHASIRMITGNENYAKQVVRNLILKGEIKKLAKGSYTKYEDPMLAVFCFKPAYFGLQDALSFHNLWEQETIPVIITSRKVRQGVRKIQDTNVLIRRIEKRYMFGFEHVKQGGHFFPYSDPEKTLIDMLYFRERLSPGVLVNLKKKADIKKLKAYLKAYPKAFRERVWKILK